MKASPQPRCGGPRPVLPSRAWPRPGSWPTLAALGLVLLLAACAGQDQDAPGAKAMEARIRVEPGQSLAATPPDATIRGITPLEVSTSLRRVTVRVSTWVSLVYGDPQPLFSEEEVTQLTPVITDALHTMPPDAALHINMPDRFRRNQVDLLVYGDGGELVYRFNALVRDPARDFVTKPGEELVDGAKLEPLPGQSVRRAGQVQVLRHPVRAEALAARQARDELVARIDRARADGRVSAEEQARLTAIADGPDAPATEVWDTFWERWDLLHKANSQGLIDTDAYARRKAEMIGQLSR